MDISEEDLYTINLTRKSKWYERIICNIFGCSYIPLQYKNYIRYICKRCGQGDILK